MSRLEELIKELCPDGVEYKSLWEVTAWDKKFNTVERRKQPKIYKYTYYLAADLKNLEVKDGNVKILTTSVTNLWTDESLVKDTVVNREIVCIPWGGNPVVQYYKGKFITGDNRIATSIDCSILNNKYLYYYMQNRINDIASFYRGSGIKHPDMSKVLDLRIPIPPMPVQEKIVKILDKFTNYVTELQAELQARKQQYEYYRDKLLNSHIDIANVELGDVCTFVRGPFGGALKKEIFKTKGYAIYEQQHAIYRNLDIRYFIDEKKYNELKRFTAEPGDIIVSCSGTIGKTFIIPNDAPKGIINQALLKLTPNKNVDVYYLQYFFENTLSKILNGVARGGAIKNVPSVAELKKITIPLPSMEIQKRIVKVLDNFDSICSDLNIGLPA